MTEPKFDLRYPVPILLLGDAPEQRTGLGRIAQDLATILCHMPEFRVGFLGRGGFGRSQFPWNQYGFSTLEQWGEDRLEEAWNDLAGDRRGIVLTVWDASRLLWFARPQGMGYKYERFLESGRFERWGYFMQDSRGVGSAYPAICQEVFSGYDRVLFASKWAWGLGSNPEWDWMPHPLNLDAFKPGDRELARGCMGFGELHKDDVVIGCVMANQDRKHWPTVIGALSKLPKNFKLWAKTTKDLKSSWWDLNLLAYEYGVSDRMVLDVSEYSDKEMAFRYSGCDVTVLISGAEGFGYPIAESLACGAPVVTGHYSAGNELAAGGYNIAPVNYRVETRHNVVRAQYSNKDVAEAVVNTVKAKWSPEEIRGRVKHLDIKKLKVQWERWFRGGLK